MSNEMAEPDTRGAIRLEMLVKVGVVAVLAFAALFVLDFIYDFGQTRFLTIDEFQWGHLSWLVSQGQVPYRDFYEHHLPLGYLFHSLFIDPDASFVSNTLLLRKIAFVHLVLGLCAIGLATWSARRNVFETMLSMILPAAFGFSLMTAIEFRGDNWSAFLLIGCLALIEVNQRRPSRVLSVVSGLLLGFAVFTTQKIVILGGLAVGGMVLIALIFGRSRWRERLRMQMLPHPWLVTASATFVALVFLALGAAYGVLELGFNANVLDALEHEKIYPGFSGFRYIRPFVAHTAWTTYAIVSFAVIYVLGGLRQFWSLPLLVGIVGALSVTAPYPYNFTYVAIVGVLCAVRGFCDWVGWVFRRTGAPVSLRPLLYLVPLLVIPNQVGFLANTTPIDYQLRLLDKIDKYSAPDEVVIDSAGSAMFRPHRGYYWYQGKAHVQMWKGYFEGPFVDELRASEALFWIRTVRTEQLPKNARNYLEEHYVRFQGDLHVLGFWTPVGKGPRPKSAKIDIVRSGEYFVLPVERHRAMGRVESEAPWVEDIEIDGEPIEGFSVHLEKGIHRFRIAPGAPAYRFSYLPPSAFGNVHERRPHAGMFEFRTADRRLR